MEFARRLEEVAELLALIELTPGPYAHLAHRQAALATNELESALASLETVNAGDPLETPNSLKILRIIAETTTAITFDAAIMSGNASLVWLTLQQASTRITNDDFATACIYGYTDIVRLLLERDIDPAANDNVALRYAYSAQQTEIVRLLLDLPIERGIDPAIHNNSPLIHTCQTGCIDIVRLLLDLPLERGVDPSARDNAALQKACANGHTEIVRLLLDLPLERGINPAEFDNYAFRIACRFRHVDIARILIDSNRLVSPAFSIAFQDACIEGHTEIARLLLDLNFISRKTINYCVGMRFVSSTSIRALIYAKLNDPRTV